MTVCNPDEINTKVDDDDTVERKGKCIELMFDGETGTFAPEE